MRTNFRAVAAAAAVAVVATIVVATPAAQASTHTIVVSAPQYESPGGTVPTIVSVTGVPTGYTAAIAAVWHNRRTATSSRKCYLTLPNRTDSYNVTGTATLTKVGATPLTVRGTGARAVLGNGYASPTAMPLATIKNIEKCHNTTSNVQLTFDDGGSAIEINSILATLKKNNTKGRFFFTGSWARANPTLLNKVKAEGHILGNHSSTHAALSKLSNTAVATEIRNGVAAHPKILRPPYAAGAFTTRLESVAAGQGYRLCRWTVDTYDWQIPSTSVMVERVTTGDFRTPPVAAGGNILMHGGSANTAPSLQAIIDAVRAKGLKTEPLV